MTKQERIHETLMRLRRRYPGGGALEIGKPYHMLVMVLLSARTRDEQVLKLAPALFAAFPTPWHLAEASVEAIASKIATIGMFRQKAKNLQALGKKLVEEFGGEVPSTMEELTSLPGVGRKTASVLLPALFGTPAIAVDVHVQRIANRLGWVKTTTPAETEAQLLEVVSEEDRQTVNNVMVPFGRATCTPGVPRCWDCPVRDLCAFAKKNLTPPANAEAMRTAIARREEQLEAMKAAAAAAIDAL